MNAPPKSCYSCSRCAHIDYHCVWLNYVGRNVYHEPIFECRNCSVLYVVLPDCEVKCMCCRSGVDFEFDDYESSDDYFDISEYV